MKQLLMQQTSLQQWLSRVEHEQDDDDGGDIDQEHAQDSGGFCALMLVTTNRCQTFVR